MARDDFTEATKRKLAMRAGGRCSRPGCDKQCWLPGTEPEGVVNIGVAAHICAASPGGPRFDPKQTSEERTAIANGIFLCQDCAKLIDADELRFPVDEIRQWKERHEAQVRDSGTGALLLPTIEVTRHAGITVSGTNPSMVTSEVIGNRIEHTIAIINNTDYEYRSIGFAVQYPEYIEHPPAIKSPPGCDIRIEAENMEWEVQIEGGGSVRTPQITHYGAFVVEAGSLVQGETISIRLRSVPDPYRVYSTTEKSMIPFWVCGEVRVRRGNLLEKQGFTAPLFYDAERRTVQAGDTHNSDLHRDKYITVRRA